MDCWYPITVPRYSNYKSPHNGLVYTRIYGRMSVPCGRCPACRRRKQNEWAYRILEEAKVSEKTAFVTLTYEDSFLSFSDSGVPTLDQSHIDKFLKDLRYNLGSYRYFLCGEYGDKFDRPHYHMCLFYSGPLSHLEISSFIEKRWFYGYAKYEENISAGRAKYCAKYSMKRIGFDYGDVTPPFARMSRRPGLGKSFLDNVNFSRFRQLDQWFVHDYQGTPYSLPRYFKERIYSKDEIEQHSLLLERLKSNSDDLNDIYFKDGNIGSRFKFDFDIITNRERLFIKHLKQENYGFKYKPRECKPRFSNRNDDFTFNEFEML